MNEKTSVSTAQTLFKSCLAHQWNMALQGPHSLNVLSRKQVESFQHLFVPEL